MSKTKLGKVIYLKMAIKMSEALQRGNMTQMSMLRASIRLFNRLLIYLAALPRDLGRGTTWRHIAFLIGREPCSARGGRIVVPPQLSSDQWILVKFVFLRQISEMKENQWEQWTAHVWKAMFQSVRGLVFNLHSQNLQWVQYAGN